MHNYLQHQIDSLMIAGCEEVFSQTNIDLNKKFDGDIRDSRSYWMPMSTSRTFLVALLREDT
jgi:hypothetical protein